MTDFLNDFKPCGENDCRCYGVGFDHDDHACGCDCPRDASGQIIPEG